MLSSEFLIRPATADDLNMVVSFWVDAHRDQVHDIPRNWYRPLYRRIVQRILAEYPVTVSVVCLRRIPDQILAFAVVENSRNYLHYVFTKKIYRRHGIARALLKHSFGGAPFRYTMKPSPAGRELLLKYPSRASYRYIQRNPPKEG